MRRLTVSAWCVALLLLGGPAGAGDAVVLDVVGQADLTRGEVLEAETPLFVPADSALILVTADGGKVEVSGPLQGGIDLPKAGTDAQRRLIETLSRLASSSELTGDDIRRTRSFGGSVPDPWSYQVGSGAAYCFRDGNALTLWRAASAAQVPVTFAHRTGSVDLSWPAGAATLSWPLDLPRRNGETYDLTVAADRRDGLELVEAPPTLPTRMHMAAWLTESGCPEQAMLLALTADVDKLFEGLGKAGKF